MALSPEFVDRHIAYWEGQLRNPYQPHRAKWPSRLFHHSPVENVVRILETGVLRSRDDPANVRPYDVAGAGVIDANDEAHHYVRLYFRPRTPTQYSIEGIRKAEDCRFGAHAHIPILVMLLLKSRHVLTQPGIRFSDRNMQQPGAPHGDNEEFFSQIPFANVFHEGGIGWTREIGANRCAEVLADSPLDLVDALEAICLRSEGEKETLLHLLGHGQEKWRHKIWVSDDLRLFERDYAFTRSVTLTRSGVVFSLNPRSDLKPIDLKVTVRTPDSIVVLSRWYPILPSVPPQGDKWRIEHEFVDGTYNVQFTIEDRMAYHGNCIVGDIIF